MDGAAGAADKYGNTLRDNVATKVAVFKNTLQQDFVNFLGQSVIPVLMKVGDFVSQNISWLAPLAGMILGIAVAMACGRPRKPSSMRSWRRTRSCSSSAPSIGLIAVIVLAYQRSETFRAIVQGAWAGVQTAVSASVAFIRGVLNWFAGLPARMAGWWNGARNAA
ncbi:hypothetical protein E4K10_18245 [Streptomyces sp. T1317-0309]|nr:hypothetical protein E4K10_18245 [Streptomyces sp. T1317-0309]